MSDESDLEIPGGRAFQNAVNNFNKQAAGAALNWFKRSLGTLTEPFFRKSMGERYYTYQTFSSGIILWLGTGLIVLGFADSMSLGAVLYRPSQLFGLAKMFHKPAFAVLTGVIMAVSQAVLGWQSLQLMAKYRYDGVAYHTRSRGISRWGGAEILVFIGMAGILLMFNLFVGALFIAGYMMNSKLKAEQDAAIMSRYQDAMDAHIEEEYLQDAALGKCPSEITYLNKPLSNALNPEVRKNIAASLVGKPVSGLAMHRTPRPGATWPKTPDPLREQTAPVDKDNPTTPTPVGAAPKPSQSNAKESAGTPDQKGEPIRKTEQARAAATADHESKGAAPETKTQAERQPSVAQTAPATNAAAKGKILMVIFVLLSVAAVAWGIHHFWPSRNQGKPPVVAVVVVSKPVQPPLVNPDPPPTAVPEARNQSQESMPTPARPSEVRTAAATDTSVALAQVTFKLQEAQRSLEREKLLGQIRTTLAAQSEELANFKADCMSRLDGNTNKIAKAARSQRDALKQLNDGDREEIKKGIEKEQAFLAGCKEELDLAQADPKFDLQKTNAKLTNFISTKDAPRRKITELLNSLDVVISTAPQKRGFLQFK